jgi:hypothetical protein
MSGFTQCLAVLHCHRDTPCTAVENINAAVRWDQSELLTVNYVLNGAVDQLRIPSDPSARGVDGLWEHTCFELFIGAENDAEYYEFNFSPSGELAAYEFRKYRDGGPLHAEGLDAKIAVQRSAETLELSAAIRLNDLAGIRPDVYLSLGLSAVIEDVKGSLSYWALKHPPGKPDFHHVDNFTLQIEPVVVDGAAIDYTAKL